MEWGQLRVLAEDTSNQASDVRSSGVISPQL